MNRCSAVKENKPKGAERLGPKGEWTGMVGLTYAIADVAPPVYRRGLSDRGGIYEERGNPVSSPLVGQASREAS